MLLDWFMLTSFAVVVRFCDGVSESNCGWKEDDFQWTAGVVGTIISELQPT